MEKDWHAIGFARGQAVRHDKGIAMVMVSHRITAAFFNGMPPELQTDPEIIAQMLRTCPEGRVVTVRLLSGKSISFYAWLSFTVHLHFSKT